ncbi:TPR-like protein [Polychaeton citri CBS 116435]|uniref:TPR-like protein n=1 Tax=Polychaeton citri CBS 116435 TaxID=1314669 RepID=A0A9P4QEW2_9PEZI|nr:TPR-like protein [Polychaeton citri CBS 116435]
MSLTKAALKAAKTALDVGNFDDAIVESQKVLQSDGSNYFAQLFQGRAYEKKGSLDDAAIAYQSATRSKPEDAQAWLGLCSLYESQGSRKVDEYRQAATKVAEIFASANDAHRCQGAIDKLVSFTKQQGTVDQNKKVLKHLLPGSSIHDFLEGRIPHPSHTYVRLVEMTEAEEAQHIQREIGNRRTRIGARIGDVTREVKLETYRNSQLEELYKQVIDWSTDDDVRRQHEEKLLTRAYETLAILPLENKGEKLGQVLDLAEGMVIIHHYFQLAWDLVLETRDIANLEELDVNILREYISTFPTTGLAKILKGWLGSELSPFPISSKEDSDGEEAVAIATAEERLVTFAEGLEASSTSPLAHRLTSEYYLHLEEYRLVVDTARHGLELATSESQRLGISLGNTRQAIDTVLAMALVYHEAPRNHDEAERLFEKLLTLDSHSTSAKIGRGLIFIEREDYGNARTYLAAASQQDDSNIQVKIELAWCEALLGNYSHALIDFDGFLPQMKNDDPKSKDLKALVQYRAGICLWELDSSKAARKDRSRAYTRFLHAIKTNANFAPAYTSLGIYYGDYARDKKRARQCFQKAFELSPVEVLAAERLAKSFADQGDWDIVEVIAQRVIDSGRARPPPGSRKKGISWPFSALGVVQMNKLEYQQAIVSFLAALRINPADYQSYVGLGESYHNSGRYNSALRTFNYVLDPPEGVEMAVSGEKWFARYMLANVYRELGSYDEAIDGLRSVLGDQPAEFGVQMSLLQTYIDQASKCIEIGLFGKAVESANEAIITAATIAEQRPHAFNLWKAVGDAAMIFAVAQSTEVRVPADSLKKLLRTNADESMYSELSSVDHLSIADIAQQVNGDDGKYHSKATIAGILSFKRAIYCSATDVHAQAVAWYNLGWAEQRAYISSVTAIPKRAKSFLKAAVRCFKRAIELEAGNGDFWNALGVVTTTLNPTVAQHSFVRSLHLNEMHAQVWTNLGVLYLLQGDHALAHQAFGRAQSTDPTYGHAWIGEGLIALLLGNAPEALNHFTHAFEISPSTTAIGQQLYAQSTFDHLVSLPTTSNDVTTLIQPLFALQQLQTQAPADLPHKHLAALLLERVGNQAAAIEALTALSNSAEAEYEATEADSALVRFVHAKSDLGRCQLAIRDFTEAASSSETALDLLSDAEGTSIELQLRDRIRASSHLTAGLALYFLSKLNEAIPMFRSALQESSNDPDVVCLLVRVLWAQGGQEERSVARDQLFETVEQHPDHVSSVTLLGAMAALERDPELIAAVKDDLVDLRTKPQLTAAEASAIENILAALAGHGGEAIVEQEAKRATYLHPERSQPWTELAQVTGDELAAVMALRTAENAVPPNGDLTCQDLARALAGHATPSAAQSATVLAPWEFGGWQALKAAITQS